MKSLWRGFAGVVESVLEAGVSVPKSCPSARKPPCSVAVGGWTRAVGRRGSAVSTADFWPNPRPRSAAWSGRAPKGATAVPEERPVSVGVATRQWGEPLR